MLVAGRSWRFRVRGKYSGAFAQLEEQAELARQTIIMIIMYGRRGEDRTVFWEILQLTALSSNNIAVIETVVSNCLCLILMFHNRKQNVVTYNFATPDNHFPV